MLRKALHSNTVCLIATGMLWLITLVVRFVLAHEDGTVPGAGWILWIVCNNLIVAGFAWQLGIITGSGGSRRATEKKLRLLRKARDEIRDSGD